MIKRLKEQVVKLWHSKIVKCILATVIVIGVIAFCVFSYSVLCPGWNEWDEGGIRYKSYETYDFVIGMQEIDGEDYIFGTDTYLEYGWIEYDESTYYAQKDGTIAKGVLEIDGKSYNFDEEEGYFLIGWIKKDEDRYYYQEDSSITYGEAIIDGLNYMFGEDGVQYTGMDVQDGITKIYLEDGSSTGKLEYEDAWYYVNEDYSLYAGMRTDEEQLYYYAEDTYIMQYGWQEIDGLTYYFDLETGASLTGWIEVDGTSYYLDENGNTVEGSLTVDESVYYFVESVPQYGWLTLDGYDYYYTEGGGYYTGTQTIDDKSYFFLSTGALAEGWVTISGVKYYYKDNTKVTSTLTISGNTYYFNSDGTITTGWVTTDDGKIYKDQYGAKVTGWQTISSSKYYFDSDGIMATSTEKDGYTIASNGVATAKLKTADDLDAYCKQLLDIYGYSLSGACAAVKNTMTYKYTDPGATYIDNAVYAMNYKKGACYHYASLTKVLFEYLGYTDVEYIIGINGHTGNQHGWVSVTFDDGSVLYYDSLYWTDGYTEEYFRSYGPYGYQW